VWKIELSKQADKFTEREDITDDEIFSLVQKFINYSKGLNENIDVKKMKGKWKGYHRIRIGKIRMLVRVNFKERTILIDRIDYRGTVGSKVSGLNN
jgi:mRNA interferase RelE/StbE